MISFSFMKKYVKVYYKSFCLYNIVFFSLSLSFFFNLEQLTKSIFLKLKIEIEFFKYLPLIKKFKENKNNSQNQSSLFRNSFRKKTQSRVSNIYSKNYFKRAKWG